MKNNNAQRLNSRRYSRGDMAEGKQYIQNGELPVHLQNHRQTQAFIEKGEELR